MLRLLLLLSLLLLLHVLLRLLLVAGTVWINCSTSADVILEHTLSVFRIIRVEGVMAPDGRHERCA